MTSEAQHFYQSIENFMKIWEIQKKFQKIFFDIWLIAFELVALDTRFSSDRILVIGCQHVNKQSQALRYY